MPYTFPLSLDDFQKQMNFTEVTFDMADVLEHERQAGGDYYTAQVGDPYWFGSFTTPRWRYDNGGEKAAALLRMVRQGHAFFISPAHRRGTVDDPEGVTYVGAAAPGNQEITGINADRRRLNISGVPAGAKLQYGDKISFQYGGIYYFFEVVNEVTATGLGNLTGVEVGQPINPDVPTVITQECQIIEPYLKARIAKGRYSTPSLQSVFTGPLTFGWEQVFH